MTERETRVSTSNELSSGPCNSTDQKDRRKDRLLRVKAVQARTGLSVSSIYRREAEGRFPKKRQLAPRCVAWYESDIDEFVADPMNYRV